VNDPAEEVQIRCQVGKAKSRRDGHVTANKKERSRAEPVVPR
jgi:hypothetical protein